MGAINHLYVSPVADGTATSVVRPSDWNSIHAYTLQDAVSLAGNTAGLLADISSGRLILAGGNNLTLSQNGNSVTLSAAAQSLQTQSRFNLTLGGNSTSAGAGFGLVSSGVLTLAGGNNVTLSQDGNAVTISAFNQTVQTQNLVDVTLGGNSTSAGAGFALISSGTLLLAGGNNVTLSQNGQNVTISGAAIPAATSWTVSDAATSGTVGRLAFTNLNGITLSLSSGAAGLHTIVGSYTVPTVTNSSWTVSDAATSGSVARLAFTNLNGVTLSLSSGAAGLHTIVGSHNAITSQSTQFLALTLGGNTAGTTTFHATNNASIFLNGGNNITLSGNGSTITIIGATLTSPVVSNGLLDISTATGSGTGITQFAAHDHVHRGLRAVNVQGVASTFFGDFQFSAGNLMALSTGGNTTAGSMSIVNLLSSATTVSSVTSANAVGAMASRFALEGHQHAGVGPAGVSNIGNTLGNTTVMHGQLVLAGGNGVTLSVSTSNNNAQTISVVGNAPASYWQNAAMALLAQTQTLGAISGSTSYIQPFCLAGDVSIGYLRLLQSMGISNTTTLATTANATGSASILSTFFVVIYRQNTGASSLSLSNYFSTSVGFTQVWSLSANANGSQWTLSQSIIHPITGGVSTFTTGFTTSTGIYSLGSQSLTVFTGLQFIDVPFSTSLPAGNYWLMHGVSTTNSTGGSGSAFTQLRISNSIIAASQQTAAVPPFGQATANSLHFAPGLGSFSTNAIATTASLGLSNITTSAAHPIFPFAFHRSA